MAPQKNYFLLTAPARASSFTNREFDNPFIDCTPFDTHIKRRQCLPLRILACIALLSIITASVEAQDKTGQVDKLFNWTSSATPGCVCAVAQNGKVLMNRAYGAADLEREVPLTPNSVFDIGSVQKQFVAAAILLLVEDGRLSLTDDVRKHIPQLPEYGYTITINHLLTHTSGLRDWTGILPLANGNPDALTLILRQRELNFAPGEEWSYSNSGYVLLKEIIARTSGMSVDDFMRKRIFEPLGMNASQYLADLTELVKNRALAYEKHGSRWKLDMKVDNDRGGGGAMLSTAGDLITWNEAIEAGRLGKFVTAKLQEPTTLNNGRTIGYARALFVDSNQNGKVIWHTGGSAGYGSVLVRFPEHKLSIAIVCNSGNQANRMAVTNLVFDLYADTAHSAKPKSAETGKKPAVGLDAKELERHAGLYFNEETNQPLRLAANNGRLRIAGGPVLDALDKNRFRNANGALSFMSDDKFEIRVISENQLELKSMEGIITKYRRAQSITLAANELHAFAGRYRSDEIGGFFDIAVSNNSLIGRANDAGGAGFPLTAVDRDIFQLGGVFIHFIRDEAGRVIGLDYSNPVVRNVKFAREKAASAAGGS